MLQQQLQRFVTDLVSSWRKQHQEVLIWGAAGLLLRRRFTLTGIARGTFSSSRICHRVKRLWRFISNPAVDSLPLFRGLVQQAFSLHPTGWVPIILDETGLRNRAMLLAAAVAYRGRALPLALCAYQPERLARSLWMMREHLLSLLFSALPKAERARFLLIADRGYAASHFFQRLKKAHISFVIRVPRRVLLYMSHQTYHLETLAAELNPGDCLFLTDVCYGPAKVKLNLLLWWETGQLEPWLLATTLPDAHTTRLHYRLRMRIEELFKDMKQSFALETCQCQRLDRITRLAFFLLICLWVLALFVHYPKTWERFIGVRGKLSFISLALEWINAPPPLRRSLKMEVKYG